MIVKIEKKEVNAVRYACTLADLHVVFYTMETVENAMLAQILNMDLSEPDLTMVWYLARQMEAKLQCDEFVKR